jgi:hypothetical protein
MHLRVLRVNLTPGFHLCHAAMHGASVLFRQCIARPNMLNSVYSASKYAKFENKFFSILIMKIVFKKCQ